MIETEVSCDYMGHHDIGSDDTPLHFSCHVCAFLDSQFPDYWIGRGRPIPWFPHSPDLTPLDFFLAGV